MNDKFFELSKEKQDRMINGAIKIFAENGYKHASTDDMVKAAGVSKGLWFHYFGNKLGLYEFMCEYAVRYFCMELTTAVDNKEKNYYTIVLQMVGGIERIVKIYPHLPLFLYQLSIENDLEAAAITVLCREKIQSKLNSLLKNIDFQQQLERKDKEYIRRIMGYTLQGITLENYHTSELQTEKLIRDMKEYVKKLQQIMSQYQGDDMEDSPENAAS